MLFETEKSARTRVGNWNEDQFRIERENAGIFREHKNSKSSFTDSAVVWMNV